MVALAEDQGLVSSTYIHGSESLVLDILILSSGLRGHQAHMQHTHICAGKHSCT